MKLETLDLSFSLLLSLTRTHTYTNSQSRPKDEILCVCVWRDSVYFVVIVSMQVCDFVLAHCQFISLTDL